jgi:hypothetical protein
MSTHFEKQEVVFNILPVAIKLGDFFDKNYERYNDEQLAYQAVKHVFKGNKVTMKLYRAWNSDRKKGQ